MTITLNKEYLHHDIRQYASRYADARIEDAEKRMDAILAEGDESAEQLMQRWCDSGFTRIKSLLGRKIIKTGANASSDLANSSSWTITVDSSVADSDAIAKNLHAYVVKYGVCQWATMYAPAEVASLTEEMTDLEQRIKKSVFFENEPTISW